MIEFARPPLTDQSWFTEFLEMRGFRRGAADSFTNGRATLRVAGSVVSRRPHGHARGTLRQLERG